MVGVPMRQTFLMAQFQRIHADRLGAHVDHALDREGADRRARRAIRRRLRPVATRRRSRPRAVRDVVRRVGSTGSAFITGEPGKAPAWNLKMPSAATILPSLVTPTLAHIDEPEVGPVPLNTSSRVICRRTGRPDFARQHRRHRFQVGNGLAAEAAADFRRRDAQVADLAAEDLRGQRAHLKVALAGGPDFALPVRFHLGDAGMRLDVALMHRRGREFLLDHHVRRWRSPSRYRPWRIRARLEMLDGFGFGSVMPRGIMSSNSSGASGFIASSTSMTCGRTS